MFPTSWGPAWYWGGGTIFEKPRWKMNRSSRHRISWMEPPGTHWYPRSSKIILVWFLKQPKVEGILQCLVRFLITACSSWLMVGLPQCHIQRKKKWYCRRPYLFCRCSYCLLDISLRTLYIYIYQLPTLSGSLPIGIWVLDVVCCMKYVEVWCSMLKYVEVCCM